MHVYYVLTPIGRMRELFAIMKVALRGNTSLILSGFSQGCR